MDVGAKEAHETEQVDLARARPTSARCAGALRPRRVRRPQARRARSRLAPDGHARRLQATTATCSASGGMVQKRCFYEWSARIPLLVRHPGGRARGPCRHAGLPARLAPTILDLVGAPRAHLPMDGGSLLERRAGPSSPSATSRRCARRGSWCAATTGSTSTSTGTASSSSIWHADPRRLTNLAAAPATRSCARWSSSSSTPTRSPRHGADERPPPRADRARDGAHADALGLRAAFDATKQYVR